MKARKPGKGRETRTKAASADPRRVTAELRAFAHPLRLRIWEMFAEGPRTTMQVAEILGEPPTRLYHHVNALKRAGLLKLRETRPIRGTVENYLEAVRPDSLFQAAEEVESNPAMRQSARAAANAVLEQARHDLLRSLSDLPALEEAGPIIVRMVIGTTPAKAARIRAKLLGFVKQLQAECGEAPEGSATPARVPGRWAVTIAFAPSSRSAPRADGG